MSMKGTGFVNVFRKQHGDTMYIPQAVQEKYPDIFELIEEPEDVVVIEEVEVKKPQTRKGK